MPRRVNPVALAREAFGDRRRRPSVRASSSFLRACYRWVAQ